MSLALVLAVEGVKEELSTSAEETIQTIPLSPVEYLIIWENETWYVRMELNMLRLLTMHINSRYGMMVRILEDLPKAMVSSVRPKVELQVNSALVRVIKSLTLVKPAKMEAIFRKSQLEAVEGVKQNGHSNGQRDPKARVESNSFLPLDKGLGMLVEAKWLGAFVGRAVRNLIEMARSDVS